MKSINAVPQKVDYKKFYTSPWGIAFIAYFVAMGLVGALTPADILKANPWAKDFCDFMAGIVPQIDRVTALNIEPDINRFYFSVMWAGSPVLFALSVTGLWITRNKHITNPKTYWRMSFSRAVLTLAPLSVLAFLTFYFYINIKEPIKLIVSTFSYPIGRALMLQFFVLCPIFFMVLASTVALGWLTGYIPRNIKKQNELEQLNN